MLGAKETITVSVAAGMHALEVLLDRVDKVESVRGWFCARPGWSIVADCGCGAPKADDGSRRRGSGTGRFWLETAAPVSGLEAGRAPESAIVGEVAECILDK